MEKKPLPVGIDDFKRIFDDGYYYVDKTLMIKELIDKKGSGTLFTRPRRFGKTINQSMLMTFFEEEYVVSSEIKDGDVNKKRDFQKSDNRHYFDGLKIMAAGEKYTKHMGQYPVIFVSLKAGKQIDFKTSYDKIVTAIVGEYKRHRYVLESENILETQKKTYSRIMDGTGDYSDYCDAIFFLSECLYAYSGKKSIILIDEYDVPLENAHDKGFYDEMISFIRSLFESALKTNKFLEFSVVTGCLRISRESIFTGFNNLKIISILSEQYDEYFGFTPKEVENMAEYYGLEHRMPDVRRWYDGYLFGNAEVYNPWSVINFMDEVRFSPEKGPLPYWSNTSSNTIVKELVYNANENAKEQIDTIMQGGTVDVEIHEDITYDSVNDDSNNLWNFLFFTGYLKKVSEEKSGNQRTVRLCIPNAEVAYIYERTISSWFKETVKGLDVSPLVKAIEDGDCNMVEEFLQELLLGTISYHDYNEAYYHGFLAGIFQSQEKYSVLSNREGGLGRYDVVLRSRRFRGPAYIIEVKHTKEFANMEIACDDGLKQIEDMKYADGLERDGYHVEGKYSICFFKKGCMVKRAGK